MEVNSVENLSKLLISCAFQRCRLLDDICRLSVSLKPSLSNLQLLLSVSDTGVGSSLEEFQELRYPNGTSLPGTWDGVLCIATTCISDNEIHHIKYDVKEISAKRVVKLPSATKNGANFSGTEVSVVLNENVGYLLEVISLFIQKIIVLSSPKIAIELSLVSSSSLEPPVRSIISHNAYTALSTNAANVDYLRLGLEDYVQKHGNILGEACQTCLSTGILPWFRKPIAFLAHSWDTPSVPAVNLKVGTGVAYSSKSKKSSTNTMEVVIIISKLSESAQSSCSRLYGRKTKVLYFRDFSPCSVSQSSLDALTSIEWKNFGLTVKSLEEQDDFVLIEWETLQPSIHIDIVLHRYHTQATTGPCTKSSHIDRTLTRKAVKLALDNLKENHSGVLLGERASKICNYAPDLAKSISGLILSSNDLNFREECFTLLGLQFLTNEMNDAIENCIKDKIISVIETNDSNSWATKEAPSLFADDAHQAPYYEYEDGEESLDYLDL